MKAIIYLFISFFFVSTIFAQTEISTVSQNYKPLRYGKNGFYELPNRYSVLDFGKNNVERKILEGKSMEVTLTLPNSSVQETFVMYSTTPMHPDLAAKYPDIHTFSGNNRQNTSEMLSLTFSKDGVWGTAQMASGNFYIEPDKNNVAYSIVFEAKNDPRKLKNRPNWCNVNEGEHETHIALEATQRNSPTVNPSGLPGDAYRPTGDTLLVYRAAMAMGAEGTQLIAGGNASTALTWLVNLVNTSNNVLIRDVSLKMQLVANNNLLIFTNAATQPFPSPPYVPTTTLLGYSDATINNIIGYTNYDVGYLHNDGIGGGWANINSMHATNKAKGIGDADYEIFIHELGHMGGSNHNIITESGLRTTFGGTIMGHRSTTRSSSGDQYSSHTMDKFTQGSYGSTSNASQKIATGNAIPVITIPSGGFYIPKSTPFKLSATATDADAGQMLTYTWEENDTSSVTFDTPNFPTNTGPLFWSVFPETGGATRYFPDLSYLIPNSFVTGETMPFATRKLNFRFIVRDNFASGGGVNFKNIRFNVDGASGPFEITWFNTSGNIITGNTTQTVTWNTNNTQNAPVSCANVNIRLSNDGGLTYPVLLANVPNNGSANVLFPNSPGINKRLMVEAANNVFFDINNANFEIFDAGISGLNTQISTDEKVIYTQTSSTVDISAQKLGSFSSNIVLTLAGVPAGATATFPNGQNTITLTPNFTTTLTISNLASVARGRYPITITSTGGSVVKTNVYNLIKTGVSATTPGNALTLNGSAYATNPSITVPSENVTFLAWIKRNNVAYTDNETIVFFPAAPVTGSMPGFYVRDDGNLRYHQNWGASTIHQIVNDEWTFVAVVVTPTQATIYKNGVPSVISLSDNSTRPFSGEMNIGSQTSSWRKFKGQIEEVKIWKRALTTAEIREQMHLTSPASEADNGLFSYYQFNQSSGTCVDIIRSYDLTLQSSPTYTASMAAVGTGVATTKTVNATGVTSFNSPTNTGLSINFGTAPNGDVVVTNLSGIAPNGTVATTSATTSNYWLINNYGTVNTGLNAQMTFSPPSGFLQNTSASNYMMYKRNSVSFGAWDAPVSASSVGIGSNQVTFAGVNSFSQFLISSTTALPLELLDFQGKNTNLHENMLFWTTVQERNVSHFEIEKSINGVDFQYFGEQKATNRTENNNYIFTDKTPSNKQYYRLKMLDFDGSFTYSKIIFIENKAKSNEISIFPNPTNNVLYIQAENKLQAVRVFDATGRLVKQFENVVETIDLSAFSNGVYTIEIGEKRFKVVKM